MLCEKCLRTLIRVDGIRKAVELPEYRKYLHRMVRWKAQEMAGTQESML